MLKKAALPQDLFARQNPSVTTAEYYRFVQAIAQLAPDEQTLVDLATGQGIEAFSPPIFAAYCSKNALACLQRLAQYKPLVGALLYRIAETEQEVSVTFLPTERELPLPGALVGTEMVFLTGLVRRATQAAVMPLRAGAAQPMGSTAYAAFLGVPIVQAAENSITFAKSDALLPFISQNESMWAFFAPELRRRLAMMETDDSYAARTRSALMELLPAGACAIEDVAQKLGCSKRTLQRKLQEENTNFQKQLNHTRELLAKTYLANTQMTTEDIAFLLGYQELGSFLRAFAVWTGQTITEYKKTCGGA